MDVVKAMSALAIHAAIVQRLVNLGCFFHKSVKEKNGYTVDPGECSSIVQLVIVLSLDITI
jgi:heme/copper-type cytochrome/quinol oxidase subunit 4